MVEPARNPSSGLIESSYAVVISNTLRQKENPEKVNLVLVASLIPKCQKYRLICQR